MPVFTVCGPSGAGKDTLIAAARTARPDIHIVRRVITRPSDAGGEDFDGVASGEFLRMRSAGAFALTWEAHGLHYGIPVSAVQASARGETVIFNGSRAMLAEAAQVFPGLTVLLVTARPEVLAARLAARGRETADDIVRRLSRAGAFGVPAGVALATIDNSDDIGAASRTFIAALRTGAAQPRSAR